MSAIRKIKKEDIQNACINIIKKEGMKQLNARRLAKELNCSTQPIFYVYKNMDEIKKDAIENIANIFYKEIFKQNYEKVVYKDIGKNYIMFAKNEPILFKTLFASEKNDVVANFINLTGPLEKVQDMIAKQTGLSKEDAKEFNIALWLSANGIASLIANDICNFTDDEIEKYLGEQYISRLFFEVKNGRVKQEVLDFMLNIKLQKK